MGKVHSGILMFGFNGSIVGVLSQWCHHSNNYYQQVALNKISYSYRMSKKSEVS